jgi:tRNA-dihydrouridine synthase
VCAEVFSESPLQVDKADGVQVKSGDTANPELKEEADRELKLKKLLEEEPWKQLRHTHIDHLDDIDSDTRCFPRLKRLDTF